MPTYQVEDAQGRVLELEGDHEPSQEEAAQAFATAFAAPSPSARPAYGPPGENPLASPSISAQPGVPQAFPTAQGRETLAKSLPVDTPEQLEALATTPFASLPRVGAEGTVTRALSNVAEGLVEQTLLTPASGALAATMLVPGVRAVAGAALSAAAAKDAAFKLGEGSVTGNPQTLTEGVVEGLLAAAGGYGVGRDIGTSRPGVALREIADANTKQIIPMSAEALAQGPLQLPAPRTRMPEFTESTLEPQGPPPLRLPAPGESTAGGILMPDAPERPISIIPPERRLPAPSIKLPERMPVFEQPIIPPERRLAGAGIRLPETISAESGSILTHGSEPGEVITRIRLPVEPAAAARAREVWSKPIDIEAQVTGAEALRSLVSLTGEKKVTGQPYEPPSVNVDLRQLEGLMQRNTVSRVESWADETIRSKLRDVSANPFLDPEFLAAAAAKGAILFKRGVTQAAAWNEAMRRQFGAGIDEMLPKIYQQSKDYWERRQNATQEGAQSEGLSRQPERVNSQRIPEEAGAGDSLQPAATAQTEVAAQVPPATSTKNAIVEQERQARGLPPAIEPARRAFGAVWDEAMAKVDVDPLAQDKLLASLRDTPRAVTDTENALLLHRQVDLQNDYGKAARDLAQAVDDGRVEDVSFLQSRVDDLSNRLLDLYNIGKKVGTETGRGLAARKMLANEDFTLANMVVERRAVNKGRPLTPEQQAETAAAQAEIAGAIEKVKRKPSLESDFTLDQAKKKWSRKLASEAEANATVAPVRIAENLLGDARTLVTAFDLSAFLRQGKLALASHPVIWARSLLPSIRAAKSPLKAFEIERQIEGRRNAPLYRRSGLHIAEVDGKLSTGEEVYVTRGVAHRIIGVKASERAYVTFLNKLRADLFDSFVNTLSRDGQTVTLPEAKVISNYLNVMTGRGDLGKAAAAGRLLSATFFSPRYLVSRFQHLLGQPLYYGALSRRVGWREGARARKLVAKEYVRTILGMSAIYGLYALAFGDEQSGDPFSSDFLKLKSGNTRVDPWAGLQQATVFLSREIAGEKTDAKGKTLPIRGNVPYGKTTAVDVGTQFLRSKLAPVPGAIVDAFQGKDVVGNPVTPGSIALDLTVPITYQDLLTTLEEQGIPRGTALTLLSLLGEGVNTYDTTSPKRSK